MQEDINDLFVKIQGIEPSSIEVAHRLPNMASVLHSLLGAADSVT